MKAKDPLTFMAIGYVFGVAGTILGIMYLDDYVIGGAIGLVAAALVTAFLRK
jgi:hypothetical protein